MSIDPKIEPWLIALLDGIQNSNHSAEEVATKAYDACHSITADKANNTLQAEFRRCLAEISFTRAGYDVRHALLLESGVMRALIPSAQKLHEAARASDSLTRARLLWAENPDKHASLRGVFQDVQPLMEMREIEAVP